MEAFQAALAHHARTCLELEPGCLRFDVCRERSDATLFLLSEVYTDQAAFDAHRQTEHFQAFRIKTADWVITRRWWFWHAVDSPSELTIDRGTVGDVSSEN